MFIIADAGSTSIDWVIISRDGEQVSRFRTDPFNASLHQLEKLKAIYRSNKSSFLANSSYDHIWYYGTGVVTHVQKDTLGGFFRQYFNAKSVDCYSDLYGAALACTSGIQDAVVCILGTGSTTCLFRDGVIQSQSPSLGFLLADEGGGVSLGKTLLQEYFRKKLNTRVREELRSNYSMDPATIREHLYGSVTPNQYLASFVPFIKAHEHDSSIRKLLRSSFDEWARYQLNPIAKGQNLLVHIVGSVGFYFKRYIFDALQKHHLSIGEIIKDPLDKLINIHVDQLRNPNE